VLPLQEFLICIEMFVAALAHAYAFPPSDYSDPLHPPQGMVGDRYS
jgi:Organic solute transporter Ostalpha